MNSEVRHEDLLWQPFEEVVQELRQAEPETSTHGPHCFDRSDPIGLILNPKGVLVCGWPDKHPELG